MGSATESHAAPQIKKFEASTGMNTASFVMIAIGILTVIVGLINNPDRMWTSYLTAFFYVACLALGAFFFVTVNHLTKAGWSASIRRLAEGMSSYIPVMVVSSIVLLFGVKDCIHGLIQKWLLAMPWWRQNQLSKCWVYGSTDVAVWRWCLDFFKTDNW